MQTSTADIEGVLGTLSKEARHDLLEFMLASSGRAGQDASDEGTYLKGVLAFGKSKAGASDRHRLRDRR